MAEIKIESEKTNKLTIEYVNRVPVEQIADELEVSYDVIWQWMEEQPLSNYAMDWFNKLI